jgi:hypothetical protein
VVGIPHVLAYRRTGIANFDKLRYSAAAMTWTTFTSDRKRAKRAGRPVVCARL